MFDEIVNKLGFGGEIRPQKYRYTVFGVNGGIFEGVKKVVELTDKEITLCFHFSPIYIDHIAERLEGIKRNTHR